MTVTWRAALIDSCGGWADAAAGAVSLVDAAAFVVDGERVQCRDTVPDPSGHGSRIVQLWVAGDAAFELLLGQVFLAGGPTSPAAVAAAIDWAVAGGADLLHLSLGLSADRAGLAAAVQRAVASGCIIVASMPARGAVVYPAGYAGVIRATGDARCAPGELSLLGPWFFGGCPHMSGAATAAGASVGAAWVARLILNGPKQANAGAVVAALEARARYVGAERRGRAPLLD